MRDREGSIDGQAGSEDINTIDDENFSVSLLWNISENWEMNVRWNDRASDRRIGQNVTVGEGLFGATRNRFDTETFARGLVPALSNHTRRHWLHPPRYRRNALRCARPTRCGYLHITST